MAKVISKTSLFIGGVCQNHRIDDFSVSPVSFGGFGLRKSFSCLKLKNHKPLRSEFHGKQIFLAMFKPRASIGASDHHPSQLSQLKMMNFEIWRAW